MSVYRLQRLLRTAIVGGVVVVAGCGTNLNEVVFQAASAAGRTAIDLWLTDLANRLADAAAADGQEPRQDDDSTNEEPEDGEEPPTEDGTGGGPDGGSAAGDPASGQAVYTANNCSACHCADATGGCALSAPSLVGVDAATLEAMLLGDAPHPAKPELSDQELADLAAYLASLGSG